jgi:prophage tail gpP-like protein
MILEVNNIQYSGFTTISVSSGIDVLSDSFVISSNNRWTDGGLRAEDECRILDASGNPLLDGYISKLSPVIGGNISIAGRDKAGDLIDSMPSGTGEFSGLTMKEIIQALCAPFGIIVTGEDGSVVPRFRYGMDERVSSIIHELVTRQGYLIYSDGSGDLVISKAGEARAPFVLVEGNNITNGSAIIDATKLHSTYEVLGQNYSDNTVNSSFNGLSTRYRPLTAVNTGNVQMK